MCEECVTDSSVDTPSEVIFEDEPLEKLYDPVTETINEGCFIVVPKKIENG